MSQYRQALTGRPVAVFALGPTYGLTDEQEWQGARAMLEQDLAKYPWLKPFVLELFGGKLDPAKLRFPHNLLAMLPASPLHQAPAKCTEEYTSQIVFQTEAEFKWLASKLG